MNVDFAKREDQLTCDLVRSLLTYEQSGQESVTAAQLGVQNKVLQRLEYKGYVTMFHKSDRVKLTEHGRKLAQVVKALL